MVLLEIEEKHFGIDIAMVESILKMQSITPTSNPPEERGIHQHKFVLPVIDLKNRSNQINDEDIRDTRIVVVGMGNLKVGLMVDAVSEVLTIEESLIEPITTIVNPVAAEFIYGVTKIDTRLIFILDLVKVLMTEEKPQMTLLLP